MSSIRQKLSFNLQSIHSVYAIEHNHFCQLNICQFPTQAKLPMLYGNIVQMLPFLNLFAKFFGLNTIPYSMLHFIRKTISKVSSVTCFCIIINYTIFTYRHCKSFFSSCLLLLNYCSGEAKIFDSPLSFPSKSL